ncbi:MAG: MgtC/SapB family protein, partial [Planctomycetaceae bacterium]|nr:MgtC/SapB family protein [Planctomycetaceae bacterium]
LIAFGLGLLVGLQREWAEKRVAGARTFPLITVFGTLCAMLSQSSNGVVLAAGVLSLASLIILGNVAKLREGRIDPGLTTELAALTMFAVGAILVLGSVGAGVAVGGGVAVLLHWKVRLHQLVRNVSEADLQAVARLVLIGLVILPILPNKTFGPYDVINPFEIWLMVVLIVGISLAAYIAYKILGSRVGTLLGGILGGFISSTATTVSYARRTRSDRAMVPVAAGVIVVASTVVFVRVIFEIAVVAPGILRMTAPPLLAMSVWMAAISVAVFFVSQRGQAEELPDQEPPSNLASAITFGLLYAAVLIGVAAAKEHFGRTGLYSVAVLSGLTDMDAITLSTAQLIEDGRMEVSTGWRLILVGAMSNLLFKGAVVALLGAPRLLGYVAASFGLSLAGGAAILAWWP